MNALAQKIDPLARDVTFTAAGLHVVLAEGREVSAPLQWFPPLLHATSEQRARWELIGDGLGRHWPEVDQDIVVESLLAVRGGKALAGRLPTYCPRRRRRSPDGPPDRSRRAGCWPALKAACPELTLVPSIRHRLYPNRG